MNADTIIGLIPARSGSKRCPGKNTRMFFGHPLIAYTIRSALESGIFLEVVVSTDSQETMEIAESYGASAILRPAEISQDNSTDFEWISHARSELGFSFGAYGILRPSNPFRTAETIKSCWDIYRKDPAALSLRTVRPAADHPYKSWIMEERGAWKSGYIVPLNGHGYDMPTQSLPCIYQQDGLFYINAVRPLFYGILTHQPVIPYITAYPENLDINTEEDWWRAGMVMREREDIRKQLAMQERG